MSGSATVESNRPRRRRYRGIVLRALAVVIGLSPFVAIEVGLHSVSWNETNEVQDPYVGFSSIRPLFVLNDEATEYEIAETRYPLFQPDSFLADKPADGFRIFCLGGSTVQGRPYSIETSFSSWLEMSLRSACSDQNWEVVNCGGVSYASYRLVPILKEILEYEPDLIVLYTGHNEFLEDRTYEAVKQKPQWLLSFHETLSSFKTYRFFRSLFVQHKASGSANPTARQMLPVEVEAELDFQNGLEFYERDDRWREGVVTHFEFNLAQMAKMARTAGTPLILVNPVSNLKGTPPFKSEFRQTVPLEVRQEIDSLATGRSGTFTSVNQEAERLRELLKLAPDYAELPYRLGQCLVAQEQWEAAHQLLIQAKDSDICPLRMLEPMHAVIFQTARKFDLPLVDVRSYFEERSVGGIPGDQFLLDHVHPTIFGHQCIAQLLTGKMNELGLLEVSNPGWVEDWKQACVQRLESLDFMYFQRGEDRLRGLQRWSRGAVSKKRPSKSDR